MEELFLRFPHIAEAIFDELCNESYVKCRQVSNEWQNFLDTERMFIWRLENHTEEYSNEFYRKYPNEDQWGQTNLHFASMMGQTEIVRKMLISEHSKADIDKENIQDYMGKFPFHYAAENGHFHVCKLLMDVSIDKNPKDNKRFTPLHLAAKKGHLKIVKLLLGNLENKNPDGRWPARTPLHLAAEKGHFEVYKAIMDLVKDKNPKSTDDQTPLHWAAREGHFTICELILANIEEKNPVDKNNKTPIELARQNYHEDVLDLLCKVNYDKRKAEGLENSPKSKNLCISTSDSEDDAKYIRYYTWSNTKKRMRPRKRRIFTK